MKSLIPLFGLSIFVLSGCGGSEGGLAPVPEAKSDVVDSDKPIPYAPHRHVETPGPKTDSMLDEETRRKAEEAAAEAERVAKEEARRIKEAQDAADAEAARLAQEEEARLIKEAQDAANAEAERLAQEEARLIKEAKDAADAEAARLAQEAAAKQAEAERLAQEAAAKQADAERLAKEAAANKQAEAERLAREAAANKQAEADRLAKEKAAAKAEAERLAKEAAAKQAEADRLAKEEADAKQAQADAVQAEADRQAKEAAAKQAEADRLQKEADDAKQAETDRLNARPVFKLNDEERKLGYKLLSADEFASMNNFNLEDRDMLVNCTLKDFEDRHYVISELSTSYNFHTLQLLKRGDDAPVGLTFELVTKIGDKDYSVSAMWAWWNNQTSFTKHVTKEFTCKKVR